MLTAFYRWIFLSVCLVPAVQAQVLLEKVTYPGFTLPSYAVASNCTITNTGQLITRYQLDGMASKQSIPLKLNYLGIKNKIDQAALGTISSDNFPVDAKTIIYRAYQKQADATFKTILLYEENGGSGQKKTNDAEAAVTLRNFIDLHCRN